jgi:hypothetical protein
MGIRFLHVTNLTSVLYLSPPAFFSTGAISTGVLFSTNVVSIAGDSLSLFEIIESYCLKFLPSFNLV